MSALQQSVEALHDDAARIYRTEIDSEWEPEGDGSSSDEEPSIAVTYSLETREWQASISYYDGLGGYVLLAGNCEAAPEAAVASLAAMMRKGGAR